MARPVGGKNKPTAKKSGPKGRTETQRDVEREEIAHLLRMGYTFRAIAERLDLSLSTIKTECAEIRDRALEAMIEDRKYLINREFAVIMDVRKELYEGMERAKLGKTKTFSEESDGEKGSTSKSGQSKEDQSIVDYGLAILKTNERVCDMFGLDEAVKTIFNVAVNTGQVSVFDQLLQAMLSQGDQPVTVTIPTVEDKEPK